MCNQAVHSCNTTWSHFHNCNTLVGLEYKSQNVSLREVAVTCFCCFVKILVLFRNGDIREVGGEAEGKDAWSVTV